MSASTGGYTHEDRSIWRGLLLRWRNALLGKQYTRDLATCVIDEFSGMESWLS